MRTLRERNQYRIHLVVHAAVRAPCEGAIRDAQRELQQALLQLGAISALPADRDVLPLHVALLQNYPNPFNGRTAIRFDLPGPQHIRIDIYNLLGERVATVANRQFVAGPHVAFWDGRDDNGRAVSSGIFIYRLSGDHLQMGKKMILLK